MDELTERAQRAVRVFKSMQFGLTSYARALSGNKNISVVLTEGQIRTDGSKIYIRPPIALGDATKHVRADCDKRDENLKLICEACAIREEVLVNVYHEIGHIAFDSFAKTSERDKKLAFEKAANSSKWGTYAQFKMKYTALPQQTDSYLGLARLINPFLFGLIQALDDVRVDSSMFRARPGIKTMLTASTWSLFNEGTERLDGTRTSWRDAPLNAQASIACYLAGVGYTGWQEWLHPTIGEAFSDSELDSLMQDARESETISEVFNLAFPVLDVLRKHGFFKTPEEQEQDEQDSSDEAEASDQNDGDGDESDREESGSDSGSPGSGDDSDREGSGETADTSANDQNAGDAEVSEDQSDNSGEPLDERGSDQGLDGQRGEETPDQSVEEEVGETGGSGEEDQQSDESHGDQSGTSQEEVSDDDSAGESREGDEVLDEEEESSDSDSVSGSSESESDADAGGAEARDAREEGSEPELPSTESSETGGGDEDDSEYSNERDSGGGSEAGGQATSPDVDGDSEAEGESTGSAGSDQDSSSTESDAEASGSGSDEAAESDGPSSEDSGLEDTEQLDDSEPIDTGADQGEGGIELPEYGSADDAEQMLNQVHETKEASTEDAPEEQQAVAVAIIQGLYFEKPSEKVMGVREHKFDSPTFNDRGHRMDQAWAHEIIKSVMGKHGLTQDYRVSSGIDVDLDIPESVMGPALLQTRRVFTDNAIAAHQHNMKSGRINRRVLGRRAWNDDNRLFTKKRLPGKRSYAVVIGIDISGSTFGLNISLAKRAAYAQAELCERAGVDFAVYAHTATGPDGGVRGNRALWLDMYQIKTFGEPWDKDRKHRLAEIGPSSENLDGHGLEYYRKRLDEHSATDKILLYYSDGKMPAANYAEELEVLQREIKTCKRKGYVLLGVGIRTDSPKRHGLDTIQVDGDEDLKKVVMHLERRLIASGR